MKINDFAAVGKTKPNKANFIGVVAELLNGQTPAAILAAGSAAIFALCNSKTALYYFPIEQITPLGGEYADFLGFMQ